MNTFCLFHVLIVLLAVSSVKSIKCPENPAIEAKDEVDFFKRCIVQIYGFRIKDPKRPIEFLSPLPSFTKEQVSKNTFEQAALIVEGFIMKHKSWKTISKTFVKMKGTQIENCEDMLYITAARYLYYIYVLHKQMPTITECKTENDINKRIILPDNSACYPQQAGSLMCTSDADVSLVGELSGVTASQYNTYFKQKYGEQPICGENEDELCTTDVLMDNNIYALSLEFAVPELFVIDKALPNSKKENYKNFKVRLANIERNRYFQWLDIVLALMQVKRCDQVVYTRFTESLFSD